MLVRPYNKSDRSDLESMYDTFDLTHQAQGIPPQSPDRREQWLAGLLEAGITHVAEREGQIVGHVVVTPATDSVPELAVFVHQSVHGYGIGTELCKHAIATAVDAGKEAITLHVERHNHAARSVYRAVGFEEDRRVGPELTMSLSLSSAQAQATRRPPAAQAAVDSS